MKYNKTILKNGLRVITVPMPSVESVTAMVLVGAGGRYESKKNGGISHFLEHMTFKGTKKRPSAFEISSVIDGIGGVFNAGTTKEETYFYVKAAAKHLSLSMDVISDILLNPLIDPLEIDKERGVIIEEINMYEDLPMRRVVEYFYRLLFPNSPLGWDLIGERDIIRKLTRKDFLDYRKRFYFPKNMVLVVAGGVKENEVVEVAKNYLESFSAPKEKSPKPSEKFTQERPRIFLKSKQTDQTHVVVGVRGNPLGHKDQYIEEVLATIIGGGMSSRLFIEVREKRGLAYYVKTDSDHLLDNGFLATSAGVDTKRADEAVKVILNEYQKITDLTSISQKELQKAKEFIKGRLVLELEDSGNVAGLYGSQELWEGKITTTDEIKGKIDEVSAEDVTRVAKGFFTNDRLNMAIIGPFEDGEKFSKILRL